MKKFLLLSALVLFGTHEVWAQGTVQFQNNTVTTAFFTNNTPPGKVSISPNYMCYGLFYSDATTGGVSNNLQFATSVGNSTTGYGVIQGSTVLALPGANPGDQAWIMVLGWDGALGLNGYTNYIGPYGSGPHGGIPNGNWTGAGRYFLQTRTILVSLGPTAGPGTVMFSSPDANHLGGIPDLLFGIPEPTSFTLAMAGGAMLYYFRRRKL